MMNMVPRGPFTVTRRQDSSIELIGYNFWFLGTRSHRSNCNIRYILNTVNYGVWGKSVLECKVVEGWSCHWPQELTTCSISFIASSCMYDDLEMGIWLYVSQLFISEAETIALNSKLEKSDSSQKNYSKRDSMAIERFSALCVIGIQICSRIAFYAGNLAFKIRTISYIRYLSGSTVSSPYGRSSDSCVVPSSKLLGGSSIKFGVKLPQ